eukprot:1715726-Amphidinium_carterae.1
MNELVTALPVPTSTPDAADFVASLPTQLLVEAVDASHCQLLHRVQQLENLLQSVGSASPDDYHGEETRVGEIMCDQAASAKVKTKAKVAFVTEPEYVDNTLCYPVDKQPIRGNSVEIAVAAAAAADNGNSDATRVWVPLTGADADFIDVCFSQFEDDPPWDETRNYTYIVDTKAREVLLRMQAGWHLQTHPNCVAPADFPRAHVLTFDSALSGPELRAIDE